MAKITYKSSIPNDKPLWLLKLQLAVSQLDATGLKENEPQLCGNRTPAG